MIRSLFAVLCATTGMLFACAVKAEDPPKTLTPDERKQLEAKLEELHAAGLAGFRANTIDDAVKSSLAAVELARRLYPEGEFPDGHANIARSLNLLGPLYQRQGKAAEAEAALKQALAMRRRLFKSDHPSVAATLSNLAGLYHSQGKLADAETTLTEAVGVQKRLYKGDHPNLVLTLNNLGLLCRTRGKLADAEGHLREALAMSGRVLQGDHPGTADILSNLANLAADRGKLDDAEGLNRDALAMRRRLYKGGDHPGLVASLNNLANLHRTRGRLADADAALREAVAMQRRLHAGDHADLAAALDNLGGLYQEQGRLTDAESFLNEALAMRRRLFKGADHPHTVKSLMNLGALRREQGRLADDESLIKEAVATAGRLYKGDHPDVATGLSNLAGVYRDQGKLTESEGPLKDSLAMRRRLVKDADHPDVVHNLKALGLLHLLRDDAPAAGPLLKAAYDMERRLHPGDHPDVVFTLTLLGVQAWFQKKPAETERLLTDALRMAERLFPGGHPLVAYGLHNLGWVHHARGKLAEAEPFFTDALALKRRLYKDADHPDVARTLHNLAALQRDRGKLAEAEPLFAEALALARRLAVGYARQKSEGEALTLVAYQPATRDGFLSVVRLRGLDTARGRDPAAAYPALWAAKGTVARVFEQRQLRARAAATDPALAARLSDLADARRRRAELLLAAATTDPGTLRQREEALKALDGTIAAADAELPRRLPAAARADRLDAAALADLRKALPADAAVVDYVRYTFVEREPSAPVSGPGDGTPRYAAFVVTRDAVAWADLETAAAVESAAARWREAVTAGKEVPAGAPARVRELVWEPVRKALPAGVRTVYVCPDADLCRLPFAALPGDKPGTVLLEDFAVATIPHAPFLLDRLWHPEPATGPPPEVLAVGGVSYDAGPAATPPGDAAPRAKGAAHWAPLPGTAAESAGVAAAAGRKKLTVTALGGGAATPAAVLAALPKARVAHLATHGFFADAPFRSAFRLDPGLFLRSFGGERVGRAANNPLVMTGLVLAGANDPAAPGRGVVTGESLIDLDLGRLELAVLSACETGLGDVAGGEGTFGLQRAFHLAGTRDVVAALWKVPDESTAALMGLFYRNLWEKNLPPVEALRRAQLEIYRNPGAIPALAAGFRGTFQVVPGAGGPTTPKPAADGKAHPLLWAAFTLSGPGR